MDLSLRNGAYVVVRRVGGLSKASTDMTNKCQTPSKTETNERTNEQTDNRTNARNRIWCILALKCDGLSGANNFNDILQLTKFRVFIG